MRRERSERSLQADIVYTTSTNPCTGCTRVSQSRCPCATPTALKTEGGRQPPEDCVRCALSAYHGGYFNATRIGLDTKKEQQTGHHTILGSYTEKAGFYHPLVPIR